MVRCEHGSTDDCGFVGELIWLTLQDGDAEQAKCNVITVLGRTGKGGMIHKVGCKIVTTFNQIIIIILLLALYIFLVQPRSCPWIIGLFLNDNVQVFWRSTFLVANWEKLLDPVRANTRTPPSRYI